MSLNVIAQSKVTITPAEVVEKNEKLNYCEKERDQAEKTVELCDNALQDCKTLNKLLNTQITKQKEITDAQTSEITSKNKEVTTLKKEKTTGHILYGILGLIVGIFLHIPLPILH